MFAHFFAEHHLFHIIVLERQRIFTVRTCIFYLKNILKISDIFYTYSICFFIIGQKNWFFKFKMIKYRTIITTLKSVRLWFYTKKKDPAKRFTFITKRYKLNFPVHLPNSIEFICIFRRKSDAQHPQRSYSLCAKLLLPNEIHTYHTNKHSKSSLCIFSKDYLLDFAERVQNLTAHVLFLG